MFPKFRNYGPIARKLADLRNHLEGRIHGPPLSAIEVRQTAAIIDALLPLINRLENRPVPPRFRVIDGGGSNHDPPPSAA